MIYYAKTHIGKVRKNNEDAYCVPPECPEGFAVVADGMGGHSAGEVASRIVVDTFVKRLQGASPNDVTGDTLRGIFAEANARVLQDAEAHPERRNMGSTATAAVFSKGRVTIGHIGDSRAYVYYKGHLKQVTRDHSYVQMLLDLGYINERQAAGHPQKNIITRAVGFDAESEADIYQTDMHAGGCLLLCTDGLNVMVNDAQIKGILSGGYETAAERLVQAALDAGGADNITVVLACAGEGGE